MIFPRASLAVVLLCSPALACVVQPPTKVDASEKEETPEPGDAAEKGEAKAVTAKADGGEAVDPKVKYALTDEEKALLEKDPKDLSPDENRKRAQALRKKILQNPDSEAAKALEEARQAALAGQLDAQLPGKEDGDGGGGQPGMVIEAPDYLRNVDSSHDRDVAKELDEKAKQDEK